MFAMKRLATRLAQSPAFRHKPRSPVPPAGSVLRASFSATTAATVSLAAASMAAYSSVVSRVEDRTPDDAREAAHHVKSSNGKTVKFKNPHPSAGDGLGASTLGGFGKILKSQLSGELSTPDLSKANIPVVKPEFSTTRGGPTAPLRATWLGHACYLVEFPGGLRVLFDPVFEDRCGPYGWLGPKRYSPPACSLAELPPVDAVVISHSHYDHLSHTSVRDLAARNPKAQFFVGLGLESWFRSSGIANVTEMDWWQDADLVLKKEKEDVAAASQNGDGDNKTTGSNPDTISARISCLPAQHSSGRTGMDRDATLWASWAVKSGGKSVWFGGDTGYRRVPKLPVEVDDYGPAYDSLPRCPQFRQIGELRGPFDLGLIPIGAYRPRWLFSFMHANPYDSVEIFKDTQCKRAMGIHWGAWALTPEEVNEPPQLLREALKKSGLPETGVFDICAVGEAREF